MYSLNWLFILLANNRILKKCELYLGGKTSVMNWHIDLKGHQWPLLRTSFLQGSGGKEGGT